MVNQVSDPSVKPVRRGEARPGAGRKPYTTEAAKLHSEALAAYSPHGDPVARHIALATRNAYLAAKGRHQDRLRASLDAEAAASKLDDEAALTRRPEAEAGVVEP